MYNQISASAILFGAVSLLPDNRYILLGLASISGILYITNGRHPSNKLAGLETSIQSVEESLQRTKEECMRSHLEVVDLGGRLFEAKLLVSKYMRDIMWDIAKCTKEVEEIRTKTLRIIEAERQHQFSAGIQESGEIIDRATTFSFVHTPRVITYKEVVQYLQYSWDIMQDIMKCTKEMEEIRTKVLVSRHYAGYRDVHQGGGRNPYQDIAYHRSNVNTSFLRASKSPAKSSAEPRLFRLRVRPS
ncbi:hypothetical protein K438DRAFT_1754312 [Mycena galopus ATCC 62051]|nr:hypothetical protein K438DRAFT_1754312 [Mycena galopus ATCC 62051]